MCVFLIIYNGEKPGIWLVFNNNKLNVPDGWMGVGREKVDMWRWQYSDDKFS